MMQRVVLVNAERQRADRIARGGRRDEARDDELLPAEALRLGPALAAPGAIGRRSELGHDSLEAEPAGVPQHDLAVLVEMAAVADGPRPAADDRLQQRLARDERGVSEIVGVEVEEVEGVVDETVGTPFADVRLQRGEVRRLGLVLDHELPVDQRLVHGKRLERFDQRAAKPLRSSRARGG